MSHGADQRCPLRRACASRSRAALLALFVAAASAPLVGSCATVAPTTQQPAPADASSSERAKAAGLDLLTLFVPSAPNRTAAAITRMVDEGLASRVESDLGRNGLTLLRVDFSTLDAALALLGEPSAVRKTVLGEPQSWNDLLSAQVARGETIFVSGRARPSEDGTVRLCLRGWCFPTVDSARARVELRLSQERIRVETVPVDPTAARVPPEDIPAGRVAVELAPGEALLVLGTPIVDAEARDGSGPATALPRSLGTILFAQSPIPDQATLLVIVPALAAMLPPGAVAPQPPVADAKPDGAATPAGDAPPDAPQPPAQETPSTTQQGGG